MIYSLPQYSFTAFSMVLALAQAATAQSAYEKDLDFALREIPKTCATLIDSKGIDWKKVEKEFANAAKAVKSDQDHWVLLTRLLARLNDGHAEVHTTDKTANLTWPQPEGGAPVSCGMFWCRSGKKILVKTVYGDAAKSGIEAGWELVKVDDVPVQKWLAARVAKLRDTGSFSTDHQAFFTACHWGLAEPPGATVGYEFKDEKGAKRKKNITFNRGNPVPWGPAVFPADLKGSDDVRFGVLPNGFGYVHVRRCKGDLPRQMDEALAAVGSAKGLILDFRANGGGGFDHDDLMGRFVPKGKTLAFGKSYASTGPSPYGGPMVVIVDAGCRSAGETGAGIFKEDGRAYMIGETPTAGMSAQKTDLELPSGLFKLYVSTGSNKARFNGGKGIEGIGVVPHEIVEYDAKDLAAGVDTLTARAEALLAKFPHNEVPYRAE
jgi:carboxyl-terminal processing protease